jgi:nucleotide-binding universal stress UspA family protein
MNNPVPKNILCPVDLTPNSSEILDWAGCLAEAFNAHVTILHSGFCEIPAIAEASMIPLYDELVTKQNDNVQRELVRMGDEIFDGRICWDAAFIDGHPAESILEWVENHRIDLVVMGSHGRRGVARFLMGSVSENVTQHVSCPTLVVRSKPGAPPRLERILCPVSMTYLTQEFVGLAYFLASFFKGQLYILNVLDKITKLGETYRELEEWLPEEVRAQSQIFEIMKKGNTAEQIIHWARDHGVDLVVLGAKHRPFLEFTILDSTAVRLIRHSPCSVLLLPQVVRKSETGIDTSAFDLDRDAVGPFTRDVV